MLKLENKISGDYLKVSLTGTTVSYLFKYQDNAEQTLATKTITTNTTFAIGFDIVKLINSSDRLLEFFNNKLNLNFYIGGDSSLSKTFSGKIYKVGLCSVRNSSDITSLFNSSGILSNSSLYSALLSRTATYTVIANNLYNQIILDIAVNSYWENYVPLSKLAKTVYDSSGNQTYTIDFIQFNFDYPEPQVVGSVYDTSASYVKTYITFQTIASGANASASTFATTISPNLS